MLNKFFHAVALFALLVLMQACSWFKEKPPEYIGSQEIAPITVPDDLDAPTYYAPLLISIPQMRMPTGDELNPGPPRAVSTAGRADANAFMAWSAAGVYLQVKDSAPSVSRRLGYVIERSGMKMLDRGVDGSYRFEYVQMVVDDRGFWQKLAFWRRDKGPNYSGYYRTRVEQAGDSARVFLLFDSGEPATTNAAEHILGMFMDRLG